MKVLPNVSRSYSLTHCVMCNKDLVGRRDKKFCSLNCKNIYHKQRSMQNYFATSEIDKRLHRNRIILQELHEEAGDLKFISPRNRLIRKGFSFNHFTSISLNKERKTYQHLYDYAWMEFSTTDVLIVKKMENSKTQKSQQSSRGSLAKIDRTTIKKTEKKNTPLSSG